MTQKLKKYCLIFKKQSNLVNQFVLEAEDLMDADKKEAGKKLLMANRGAPRQKKLMKMMQMEGMKQLCYQIESEHIRDKKMDEIGKRIAHARELGDLKENAEYHAAREEMSLTIYKKQKLSSHAPFTMIEDDEIETDEVEFGNKVMIHEEGKDKPEEYYILGPLELELDLYPMIATYHSPFGKVIVGKKVNDKFTLTRQDEEINFTVIAIEKIS